MGKVFLVLIRVNISEIDHPMLDKAKACSRIQSTLITDTQATQILGVECQYKIAVLFVLKCQFFFNF